MSTPDTNRGDTTVRKSEGARGSRQGLEDVVRKDIGRVGRSTLKSLSGFRTFILRGNVVDLAIGIAIGAAFTSIVTAFVKDIITPLVPVSHGRGLATAFFTIPWTGGAFNYGDFINAVISFLIVAAILYFLVVQPVNTLMKLYKPQEAEIHVTRDCPYCLQAIDLKATRCPYCTSMLTEGSEQFTEKETVLRLPESLEKLSELLAEKILRNAARQEQTGTSTDENAPQQR